MYISTLTKTHIPHIYIRCFFSFELFRQGKISGVVSERDYVCKIALLGKTSKVTPIKGACMRSSIFPFLRPWGEMISTTRRNNTVTSSSSMFHPPLSSSEPFSFLGRRFLNFRNLDEERQPHHGIPRRDRLRMHGENAHEGHQAFAPPRRGR